ncbi:SpoIIE family protein phosphatase [Streptomyces tricolor]|nr:SpoIIE family protein phosphatase [Streptomyces tricolor]
MALPRGPDPGAAGHGHRTVPAVGRRRPDVLRVRLPARDHRGHLRPRGHPRPPPALPLRQPGLVPGHRSPGHRVPRQDAPRGAAGRADPRRRTDRGARRRAAPGSHPDRNHACPLPPWDAGSGGPSSTGWRCRGQILGVCGIAVEASNLRQYLDDLENAHQRLALLDAAATRVGTTLDVEATCAELADFLAPSLADIAAVGLVEQEFFGAPPPPAGMLRLRKMKLSAPPELLRHLNELGGTRPYVDLPRGSAPRRCMDSGRPWLGNLASDELFQKVVVDPERVRILRAAGVHSMLVVPLPTAGHSVGIVMLMRVGASPGFSSDDILTAQGVAARAAVSIDSAHRYSHEHAMTLELQRALLSEPDRPHPTVEVATRYLPSGRSALVGGDWYDSIALPDCRTLLVMGDVMGHGFQAAVAMSQYRSVLRTVAAAGLPVDAMLTEADRRAARIGLDRAATCLLVLLDTEAGTCTAATAGHLPPLVIRPGGSAGLMHLPAGPPIGTELGDYEMTTFAFEPGAVLLLYTDGLVEQRNVDIDDSVRALTTMGLSADDSLEHLLDTVLTQLTDGMCEDDIALPRRPPPPLGRQQRGQVTNYVTWPPTEPLSGFEPETYALRVV